MLLASRAPRALRARLPRAAALLHAGHAEPDRSEGDINLSPARQAWQASHIGPETQELLDADADAFLHQSLSTPCLNALRGAQGVFLEDVEGRRIMDFHGNSVHQVGFGHPRVIEAVTAQLQALPFCPRRYTNEPAVELARRLGELAPGDLSRVLLAPGGTSAIGIALKLARLATGRHKTVSMFDSFHGASLDAISVGGEAVFRAGVGPLMPGGSLVPPSDEYRCMWDCTESPQGCCTLKCADYIEYVLEREGDVGAVIAEPMRWTPYVPPRAYWQRVRELCDKHGALLIFDEIPNSLGRTGSMFTCENYVEPDILVLGKGLGGGVMPLAAVIAREDLNDVGKHVALGHYTHEKSPVACAAALATLDIVQDEDLCGRARELGALAMERLRETQARHEIIGDVRGKGLLLGIELVQDRGTKERALDAAEAVLYGCLSRGLSFKLTMGNIVTLCPPLIISEEQLMWALDVVEEEIESASIGVGQA